MYQHFLKILKGLNKKLQYCYKQLSKILKISSLSGDKTTVLNIFPDKYYHYFITKYVAVLY